MNLPQQLARHLREVHFGENWTDVTIREHVSDITWQQATAKISSLNTIAALVYHINYYVKAVLRVLRDEPLNAKDANSFNHPAVDSPEDWERLLQESWTDAEDLAQLVEQLPESKLGETFVEEKYGSYYRNIQGVIEHAHYHLGQIVLLKKLLSQPAEASVTQSVH
ncbi:DinB family protein [Rufibacter roseolus]|uniref:DinB family protein n=1 Tax=Rufibacter roseolus TaxID=2817375 RepID=UPI001B316CA2|nr:DinB family protein [Rufibacter roseolus]